MRSSRAVPAPLSLLTVVLLLCAVPLACNRTGGALGSSSASSGDQPQQKQAAGAKKGGSKTQSDFTEPVTTVSGKPDAASDSGTPAAVAHRSVAEPGVPEGTVQDKPTPKPQAAQP